MLWYGGEALLAHAARWHLSPLSPFAWMLRDLLLPVLWIKGWRTEVRLARQRDAGRRSFHHFPPRADAI